MKFILCLFLLLAGATFGEETNLTLTIGGVTYQDIRFGRVTPSEITIFHSSGVAVVPLEQLPRQLQKRFGYDPQKAGQLRGCFKSRFHG